MTLWPPGAAHCIVSSGVHHCIVYPPQIAQQRPPPTSPKSKPNQTNWVKPNITQKYCLQQKVAQRQPPPTSQSSTIYIPTKCKHHPPLLVKLGPPTFGETTLDLLSQPSFVACIWFFEWSILPLVSFDLYQGQNQIDGLGGGASRFLLVIIASHCISSSSWSQHCGEKSSSAKHHN